MGSSIDPLVQHVYWNPTFADWVAALVLVAVLVADAGVAWVERDSRWGQREVWEVAENGEQAQE